MCNHTEKNYSVIVAYITCFLSLADRHSLLQLIANSWYLTDTDYMTDIQYFQRHVNLGY